MRKKIFIGVVLFILFGLFICFNVGYSPKNYNVDETIDYNKIKNYLDYNRPGFGRSDYGDLEIADIPKAYAMFLSAELMKGHRDKKYDLEMALNAGNWLLDNADLNQNGIYGWGVPIAWDAFGDDSINEKNTEYTIATGIVINSLLDWIELSNKTAPKEKILEVIRKSILPYINNEVARSPSGLYNYSLKHVDRKYNCFNAAIYMAGQMQRFTKFIGDEKFKKQIYKSVDKVILAAIKHKKIDPNGGWFWSYSMEEGDVPNDLAHAGYIIEGLLTYMDNGGSLKYLLDKKLILKHFDTFSSANGEEWYFYPSFYKFRTISPRLYGLGMSLHVLSKYINDREKISNLLRFVSKYKKGPLYTRWQNEDIVIAEYLTYLLYGLSSIEFEMYKKNAIFLNSTGNHLKEINSVSEKLDNDKISIPLIEFNYSNIDIKFSKKELYTTISIDNKELKFDKFKSIPIKIMDNSNNYFVLFRELITNHLLIAKIDKKNYSFIFYKIDENTDSFLDFRNSIVFNNELILIAYESKKSQNTLISYNINNNFQKIQEIKLPSLEDPAGRTYEVIPKIMILKNKNSTALYILGGRMYIKYENLSIQELQVPPDTEVFTDALIKDGKVYSIYRNKFGRYIVYGLSDRVRYFIGKNFEIIYKLYDSQNRIKFKKLGSNMDGLVEMFIYDFLNNKGSGSLYLGSNNIEGWSAWAQIYYLNGFLSFLEIAKSDIEFYGIFKRYIDLIKNRLDLEIFLLIQQYKSKDGFGCRVFSVDRSLSNFAVQSSRFAMLLDRYLKLFPDDDVKNVYKELSSDVISLENHMEILEKGTSNVVSEEWNKFNSYYLRWPKGNKFYFDGLPVPYNHQNEWASFLLQSHNDKKGIGKSIIMLFLNHITNNLNNKNLPKNAIWPYWWGKAWDGYLFYENISVNKKQYFGDKGNGWISFRSIDAISILKLYNSKKMDGLENYKNNIFSFIIDGHLYPFVSSEFLSSKIVPLLDRKTIARYIRFTSPWEFDNAVWAYLSFIKSN